MSFIYHMVPKQMNGDILVPLASLKMSAPEAYAREMKKYDDHPQRRLLPQRQLKILNCPQEEVLHFSPIHPHKMFNGLKSVFPDWNHSQLFYEIPIEHVGRLPAILFDMNRTGTYVFGEDEPIDLFQRITPETYRIYDELPKEALEFYQQWQERGERGAPAMGRIAHIMVQGPVSIAGCHIIDWKNPPAEDLASPFKT
jgi:hypothetical protein